LDYLKKIPTNQMIGQLKIVISPYHYLCIHAIWHHTKTACQQYWYLLLSRL